MVISLYEIIVVCMYGKVEVSVKEKKITTVLSLSSMIVGINRERERGARIIDTSCWLALRTSTSIESRRCPAWWFRSLGKRNRCIYSEQIERAGGQSDKARSIIFYRL